MSQEQGSPLNKHRWETESLRFSTFILPGADIVDSESWWTKVVGRDPEEVLSRPGTGRIQQTGNLAGGKLALAVRPGRVDWHLRPAVTSTTDLEEGIPTMGSIDDVLGPFRELIQGWLGISPALNRLAFGAVLLFPIVDRASGYSEISNFLPNVNIPVDSSDFLYQINRPRISTSGVSDLTINRLSKWSVMQSGIIEITFTGATAQQTKSPFDQTLGRLELDINTAAEYSGQLPVDKLPELFEELVTLGTEIMENGDMP